MTEPSDRITWGIYDDAGILVHVGIYDDAPVGGEDCWQIFLGWPGSDEISAHKASGFVCRRVVISPCEARPCPPP